MNETGKRRGMVRNIASLAGLAVFTGVVAVLEARQTAHDADPAVIELKVREAKRRQAQIAAEERKCRRDYLKMTIMHYLTLALLLVAMVLWTLLFLGSMISPSDAIRRGRPIPPPLDPTMPVPMPVL